ncbi:OmpH family outer membrane protein [Pararhodobacter oceanensis]|uniref:OmpH family outer membrane protein n=1 Tax=Pararhodobacter oceanensis TaxID=2172121 RepID=UPI003A942BAE
MRATIRSILLTGTLFCVPVFTSLHPQQAAAQGVDPAAPSQGARQLGFASGAQVRFRVLDQDRLLTGSILGQQLQERLRDAERELEAENNALAEQLATEESELTALRPTLSPEEFRTRADAFDRRVEEIRAERERLNQQLARRYEADVQAFFATALPVLDQLMMDEGLNALLRPDILILGAEWLDITDQAIERLDATVVQVPDTPDTPETPDAVPEQSPEPTLESSPEPSSDPSPDPSPEPGPDPAPDAAQP